MKNLKIVFFSLILLFFLQIPAQASTVNVPVLSDINSGIKSFSEPMVSGFTDKFSSVLVYVDGNFYSEAETVSSLDRDSFYFFINKLPSEGSHSLFLIARNLNGILSAPTKEFNFLVSHKLNSPQIVKHNAEKGLYFFGESLNENTIEMYLDDKLFSDYYIKRNSTNTFEFNESNVSTGKHEVFFIAKDAVGRKSLRSNKMEITVKESKNTDSAQVIDASEKQTSNKPKPTISDKGVVETIDQGVIVQGVDNIIDEKLDNEKKNEKDILDDILKEITENNLEENGAISESGEKQNDLQWNLVIFLVFLVAIILWIIWVNREIKEDDEESENLTEKEED